MRWRRGHQSVNVEDRRGRGGGRMRMPGGRRGGLGCGGILFVALLSIVFKQDFFSLLDVGAGGGIAPTQTQSSLPPGQDPDKELKEFVSFVLDDTQELWAKLLPKLGSQYRDAKLVLFTDTVQSACGYAQAASGPFYCPGDQKVYIDLGFYNDLARRFGAPGDFAQAYVLAHEVGHHVQTLLGISTEVRRLQAQNKRQANDLSVRMELQADCLAGVWANSAARKNLLEPGDVEEGMGAAAAVGDDRIQKMSGRRYINPESFTHGSAEQRVQWFRKGLSSGNPDDCDTFENIRR